MLRNNKAAGEDGTPAEIYKSCADTLVSWLHEVVGQAWRDETVPDDWGSGILMSVHKKGNKTKCENYRSISLINIAVKIFAISIIIIVVVVVLLIATVDAAGTVVGTTAAGRALRAGDLEQVPVEDNVMRKMMTLEESAQQSAQIGVLGLVLKVQGSAVVKVFGHLG
ncbi:unnamed protein product [Dibothriocephalus latus]|uniref:Uncharacterized protein n=1 Tax=Dibothriocephalus latus TaxID=60516 RepID=A0A3P7L702_DIBLA|nr:unnamed protein product [Dibothriocephalus latus]